MLVLPFLSKPKTFYLLRFVASRIAVNFAGLPPFSTKFCHKYATTRTIIGNESRTAKTVWDWFLRPANTGNVFRCRHSDLISPAVSRSDPRVGGLGRFVVPTWWIQLLDFLLPASCDVLITLAVLWILLTVIIPKPLVDTGVEH